MKSTLTFWVDAVRKERRYRLKYGQLALWLDMKAVMLALGRSRLGTSLFRSAGGIGKFPLDVGRS